MKQDAASWLPLSLAATTKRLRDAERAAPSAAERQDSAEAAAALEASGRAWAGHLVHVLQQALDAEIAPAPAAPVMLAEGRLLSLSLLDEDSIDDEIAVSRLVQGAEIECEALLRELAALCSGLRGLTDISVEANPLRPAVIAGALRRGVAFFGLRKAVRLLLLRELAIAVGAELAAAYQRQIEQLTRWGVEPARFTLRLTLGERAAGATPKAADATAVAGAAGNTNIPSAPALEALMRLAQWTPAEAGPPLAGNAGTTAPNANAAADVMTRLLSVLVSRVALPDGARELIHRLDEPARRIATQEPGVWQSLDHPLWQLLDRLVSAGSVHDESDLTRPGDVGAALERAVRRLEQADTPDAEQCRAALDAVDFAVTDLLDEQSDQIETQADALQEQVVRDAIEAGMREQIIEQLRGSAAPPALRQFLLGPWSIALAHAARRHGPASDALKAHADLVDDAVAVATRTGNALDGERLVALLARARSGLVEAAFLPARVEAELADLADVLEWPPQPLMPVVVEAAALLASAEDHPALGLHESLPTVPIDTFEFAEAKAPTAAALQNEAWLDTLEPGTYCRMFLLDRWMNTQLSWRSLNRSMFVFASRHGGRTHSLSRRALVKLRAAGLATSIERGQWVVQAMNELAAGGGA